MTFQVSGFVKINQKPTENHVFVLIYNIFNYLFRNASFLSNYAWYIKIKIRFGVSMNIYHK